MAFSGLGLLYCAIFEDFVIAIRHKTIRKEQFDDDRKTSDADERLLFDLARLDLARTTCFSTTVAICTCGHDKKGLSLDDG